ncbi:DUF202 domain-containing protein [Kushneria marisflavi]|uniref:Uncharacterized protein n=1 Tax=Kushneria marisflavi TaxID=157779 RepID=A0A240UMW2_9GAMM|nr:DUF202 domain-containing protein [Kushneria marisflavi]ART62824.1 hypothetical protein B9H00_06975 [Kushneria marisflavi]RKD84969.1 uncharacterized protein DUF202 [Kushneria marisflavi]
MNEPARDPGLQPERTGLAWSRTAFVTLLFSALLLRGGIVHHEPLLAWAGVVLLAATGALYAWAGWRLRMTATLALTQGAPVTTASTWVIRITTLVVALVGLTVAASVLYHGQLIARLAALMR